MLTLRPLHPTKEQRDATIGFGAVELGIQTLDQLAEHVGRLRAAAAPAKVVACGPARSPYFVS